MSGLGKGPAKKARAITGGKKESAGKPTQTKNNALPSEPRTRKVFLLADTQIARFDDYLYDQKKKGNKTDMTKVARDIIENFLVEEGY